MPFPIAPADRHHIPLSLKVEFYDFITNQSDARISFNFNACNFQKLNACFLNTNWDSLLSGSDINENFSFFNTNVIEICSNHIPRRVKNPTSFHGTRIA